jgi:hypothetical protein
MAAPRLLLQTSIAFDPDDWHVGRFSLLTELLATEGKVTARNRTPDSTLSDPVIRSLSRADFDEVWLLGTDGGSGLTDEECAAVDAFQRNGGGVFTARDHQNMGLWLRRLQCVGGCNFFHAEGARDPDPQHACRDDRETMTIDFPNFHSGANGDLQRIGPVAPLHPLLRRSAAQGVIEFLPAHPHEGGVGSEQKGTRARTVARGRSLTTGKEFDLIVALDRSPEFPGRGVVESSFHHLADYNWDISRGAPSFVTEPPGSQIRDTPGALDDAKTYVRNTVRWLAPDAG